MREIAEVELMEISVVDYPANPFCVIISIDGKKLS